MSRRGPAFGDAIGDTVADALNALYRHAQFLERVGTFLNSLGDLTPPCAFVPYITERTKLIALTTELRRTMLPATDPSVRAEVETAFGELLTKLRATPILTKMWIDAPEQWKAGAYEASMRVPTSGFGWVAGDGVGTWEDVKHTANVLANVAVTTWLITMGTPGIVVAGVLLIDRGGGFIETLQRVLNQRATDVRGELKAALDAVIAEAVKFDSRFKPSIYQQVLGAWLLVQGSPTPDVMKAAMANMNPYTLPSMPDTWNGSFAHMRQASGGESANWLIALLLGAFLGLGVAALSTE